MARQWSAKPSTAVRIRSRPQSPILIPCIGIRMGLFLWLVMRILLVDNYDSFTHNLLHYLEKVTDVPVDVLRNDAINLDDVEKYSAIVLSPGPGLPEEAGILMPLINRFKHTKKIMGVCLGHQAIAMSYGAKMINLSQVAHGVAHTIEIRDHNGIFQGISPQIRVGRYHSWSIQQDDLPKVLNIDAVDADGNVMAFSHETLPLFGVQFHPESILTEFGEEMMRNWVYI